MITKRNMSINILKKEVYSGSYKGMYYRLEKVEEELKVSIWKGPYCYAHTPKEERTVKMFPFSVEGQDEAIKWLKDQYIARKEEWSSVRFI